MKLDYEVMKLVTEYIHENCAGNSIDLSLTPEERIVLKTSNKYGDVVKIIVYPVRNDEPTLLPRVIKEERLQK